MPATELPILLQLFICLPPIRQEITCVSPNYGLNMVRIVASEETQCPNFTTWPEPANISPRTNAVPAFHRVTKEETLGKQAGKNIAFGWYSGKYSHLDWLLPLLPEATHFCDVFGGSAAVLINRKPSPVETYNDVDSELSNRAKVTWDFTFG
jgi:hypothetical protein